MASSLVDHPGAGLQEACQAVELEVGVEEELPTGRSRGHTERIGFAESRVVGKRLEELGSGFFTTACGSVCKSPSPFNQIYLWSWHHHPWSRTTHSPGRSRETLQEK